MEEGGGCNLFRCCVMQYCNHAVKSQIRQKKTYRGEVNVSSIESAHWADRLTPHCRFPIKRRTASFGSVHLWSRCVTVSEKLMPAHQFWVTRSIRHLILKHAGWKKSNSDWKVLSKIEQAKLLLQKRGVHTQVGYINEWNTDIFLEIFGDWIQYYYLLLLRLF